MGSFISVILGISLAGLFSVVTKDEVAESSKAEDLHALLVEKAAAPAQGSLTLRGDRAYLKRMIDEWAGGLSDKVKMHENGTVAFDVSPADVFGDATAKLLYDLVHFGEPMIFYAGTDGGEAAELFVANSKIFSRAKIAKVFTGRVYTTGG
ncbi:MAG: hypothetical protein ACRD68_04560, partial [Pyrinomonadaceae bacterium]